MAPDRPELADILRQFTSELPSLTVDQAHVVRDVMDCRTAALGGHVHECDRCGHQEISYNSCRNRHCPKCQCLKQARWLEARQADLLPVEYFHVVFTITDVLHPIFHANPRLCYGLLFEAAAETLKEVALNPERLGARIGFTAVLHTWTQTLLYHPHVHCIVPGGGLSPDGTRWVSCKPGFFLPVRVLSTVFRGKLLSKIEAALHNGKLRISSQDPAELLRKSAGKPWVVYSKPPFDGPEQVLRYLGRYTHRIAISNSRIIALEGRRVTFRWKDRADGNKTKVLSLDGVEFARRFLMHVVPKGFMRIRHYGILSNALRKKSIALCRQLLNSDVGNTSEAEDQVPPQETWQELLLRITGIDVTRCPACGLGQMEHVQSVPSAKKDWTHRGRATST